MTCREKLKLERPDQVDETCYYRQTTEEIYNTLFKEE